MRRGEMAKPDQPLLLRKCSIMTVGKLHSIKNSTQSTADVMSDMWIRRRRICLGLSESPQPWSEIQD